MLSYRAHFNKKYRRLLHVGNVQHADTRTFLKRYLSCCSLNQLPYSVAVIKETLRLFPAASTIRSGEPGFSITDGHDRKYSTDGCLIWLISHTILRDPSFWPQSDDFLPEHWLIAPGEQLHLVKGTLGGPLSKASEPCTAKELAMVERLIVMALMVRTFEIEAAYKDLDAKRATRGTTRAVDAGNRSNDG